jgi:hypothetical protein
MLDLEGQLYDRLEEVSIEHVHVGDYVSLPSAGPPAAKSQCVLFKAPTRLAATDEIAGWQVELKDGGLVWLRRHTKVIRRRFAPSRSG